MDGGQSLVVLFFLFFLLFFVNLTPSALRVVAAVVQTLFATLAHSHTGLKIRFGWGVHFQEETVEKAYHANENRMVCVGIRMRMACGK